MKEFLALSFGNETVVFIIFVFIFSAVMDDAGLINYISNRFISFKILNGRPWVFSALVLIGAYISSLINIFAAILFFWDIIYIVSERFGFERYDRYPTLMLIGIVLAAGVGGVVLPYKPVPLLVLKSYSQISGMEVDFLKYMLFPIPTTFLVIIFYVLICRFIFRPDMKRLKEISIAFADQNALILDKKQKISLLFLAAFIFLMIAPSLLPSAWLLTKLTSHLGIVGNVFLLLIVMF